MVTFADDGVTTPNPYETPFFRKWRGNGHTSNGGAPERNFENPLYHERTTSPTSPPLPPRPEHPYATLEELNNPYAQIPADLQGSLDEKPLQSGINYPQHVDPLAIANPYDHIYHQSPTEMVPITAESCPVVGTTPLETVPMSEVLTEGTSCPENPYLKPVDSVLVNNAPNGNADIAMNSSTILYAHIQ